MRYTYAPIASSSPARTATCRAGQSFKSQPISVGFSTPGSALHSLRAINHDRQRTRVTWHPRSSADAELVGRSGTVEYFAHGGIELDDDGDAGVSRIPRCGH